MRRQEPSTDTDITIGVGFGCLTSIVITAAGVVFYNFGVWRSMNLLLLSGIVCCFSGGILAHILATRENKSNDNGSR